MSYEYDYRKFALYFPQDWRIAIVPSEMPNVARFCVMYKTAIVSVYLDTNDMLGREHKSYFEVYPFISDNDECDITSRIYPDVDKPIDLINEIQRSIDYQLTH